MKSALDLIDIQNDFVEKGVFDIQGAADIYLIINDIQYHLKILLMPKKKIYLLMK